MFDVFLNVIFLSTMWSTIKKINEWNNPRVQVVFNLLDPSPNELYFACYRFLAITQLDWHFSQIEWSFFDFLVSQVHDFECLPSVFWFPNFRELLEKTNSVYIYLCLSQGGICNLILIFLLIYLQFECPNERCMVSMGKEVEWIENIETLYTPVDIRHSHPCPFDKNFDVADPCQVLTIDTAQQRFCKGGSDLWNARFEADIFYPKKHYDFSSDFGCSNLSVDGSGDLHKFANNEGCT